MNEDSICAAYRRCCARSPVIRDISMSVVGGIINNTNMTIRCAINATSVHMKNACSPNYHESPHLIYQNRKKGWPSLARPLMQCKNLNRLVIAWFVRQNTSLSSCKTE